MPYNNLIGGVQMRRLVGRLGSIALAMCLMLSGGAAVALECSVWLVESSRFMNVPLGAFLPNRADVPGGVDPSDNIN
jgi:hypothetical protein